MASQLKAKDLDKALRDVVNAEITAVLERLLKNGHGGGNWRRMIILELDKLKGES